MNLPAWVAEWQLRRHLPVITPGTWNEVCPANPSRLSLLLTQSIGMNLEFSPFSDGGPGTGLNYGADDNYLMFYAKDNPRLTTAAWYVYVPFVVPVGTVQAWEETIAGT